MLCSLLHSTPSLFSRHCGSPLLCPSSMPLPVSPQGFCTAIPSSRKAHHSLDLQVLGNLLRSVSTKSLRRGSCPPSPRCPPSPPPRALPAHHLFYFPCGAHYYLVCIQLCITISLMGMPVHGCRVQVLVLFLQCRSLRVSHFFSFTLCFLLCQMGYQHLPLSLLARVQCDNGVMLGTW